MSDMTEKLAEANKKAENQKAERRARTVKGSHLTQAFVQLATEAGADIRENTGFYVIVGKSGKSQRIYVAKRGGIVDLLGFTLTDAAVRQISREEAKEKHMGRVQGRLNLELSDADILSAFKGALKVISTPAPVVERKAKKAKRATETTTVAPEVAAAASPVATETAISK